MRSLFGSDPAKRRVLPASLRRLIVDLKAEHPTLNLNEIARICYVQRHWAHEGRQDGRRSPSDVLGSLTLVRHHPGDLERAFFSTISVRRLDVLGYARLKHWRIYGEEGLARCEVAVWLGDDGLVVEYGGETLSRYDVSFSPGARGSTP